ncbi:hypothetical protein ACE1B6_17620 [Aerosakkonemataceae cyanobacterium BLCC-F154]|uniref:Uncharacterized protein n=1 Tax=Floridaenema fluviatile BLCC-F154 TaxID=3153640 RepID=A0ABV4YE07_9CYAN
MNITKFVLPLAIASSFISQPAFAGGTLALNEIMPLVRQSSKLNTEVNTALRQVGKKPSEITCVGVRLGRHFGPLSAYRVAPFDCNFGSNKVLHIEAENLVTLRNGHSIFLTQFSELQPKPEEAKLVFRLKSWNWE